MTGWSRGEKKTFDSAGTCWPVSRRYLWLLVSTTVGSGAREGPRWDMAFVRPSAFWRVLRFLALTVGSVAAYGDRTTAGGLEGSAVSRHVLKLTVLDEDNEGKMDSTGASGEGPGRRLLTGRR